MAAEIYTGYQYSLRASSPMPIGAAGGGNFVLFTFGAEVNKIDIEIGTNTIKKSTDFRGQGGDLISASYSRMPDRSGILFQSKLVYNPTFVDEDVIPT